MVFSRASISFACSALAALAYASLASETDRAPNLDFDPAIFTPPSNGIKTLAGEHNVPLSGISDFQERNHLETDDRVTLMVTSLNGDTTKQWLLSLRVSELTAKEKKRDLPAAQTLYSTSGHQFTFESDCAALALTTWGPVTGPGIMETTVRFEQRTDEARGLINPVFLAIGLHNTGDALTKLHQARSDGRVDPERKIGILNTPVSEEVVRDGLELVTKAGLTLDDERAIAGSVPAMLEFFNVAARSHGLREIIWEIIDKPSLWSIIRHFGRVEAGITFHSKGVRHISSEPWGMPGSVELYQIPFTLNLNDEPALDCVMIVTEPRPPLLTSAGIIGLTAHQPGTKDRRAVIRLLAAQPGGKSSRVD